MSWFKSKNNSKTVALFDIGSGDVAIGIAKVFDDVQIPPLLLYTHRQPIPIDEELDFDMFIKGMTQSLERASEKIHDAKIGKIDEVRCFLGSPWFASQTRTIEYQKTIPFTVTKNILDDLVNKEVALFSKTDMLKYTSSEKMAMIETVTINCKLNGYEVGSPYQKNITTLSIDLFLSMGPEAILDQIRDIIHKYIHVPANAFRFHTSIFSEYVLLRDLFVHNENYMIVNIDGEITDISFIKNNVLYESVSFPIGKNALIRAIAEGNGGIKSAGSLLAGYISGHLENTVHNKIEQTLAGVRTEWLALFSKSLTGLAAHRSLPSTVFLITEDQVTNWFTDAIKREEFSQYMLSDKRFSVVALSAPSINEYCTFKEGVSIHQYDLITHLLYVSRHGNK